MVLVASGLGGDFARSVTAESLVRGGASGLLKTWQKEAPELIARVVDLDVERAAADDLAEALLSELRIANAPQEIGLREGKRLQLVVRDESRTAADDDTEDASVPPVRLDADSVVLLTGGARGMQPSGSMRLLGCSRARVQATLAAACAHALAGSGLSAGL